MSNPATRHAPLTGEEFLRFEEESSVRHEYVAGLIHALTGESNRHNLISGNLFHRCWDAVRGTSLRVYAFEIKLRAAADVIYYPDLMIAPDQHDGDATIEELPCVIVEVTSPTTETIDRREKVLVYRSLPTVLAYLVVHQERRRVERHWRDEEGTWWHADAAGSGRVPIPCPELTLTLDEIYAGIDIPG